KPPMRAARPRALFALATAVHSVFAALIFARLGQPLLWEDEAETAMHGRNVLEYGVPKMHVGHNIVYGAPLPLALGRNEALDAYVGSPWGQYFFAAPAVAWSEGARDLAARTWRMRLLLAPVLFGLFNLFYPAFAAVVAAGAVALGLRIARTRAIGAREGVSAMAPYALACAAALPIAALFRLPAQSRALFEIFTAPSNSFSHQLASGALYLLRFEFAAPVLAGAAALALARRRVASCAQR